MVSKVRIDMELTGDRAVARGIDNVGDSAQGASGDLDQMAKSAGFVDKSTTKASDGLEKFGYNAKILDRQVMILRGNLRAMAVQFEKTGDVDILRKIKSGKGDLDSLTQLRKQITGLLEVGGKEVGGKFGEEFTKALMALRGPAIGALVGIAVAAAPFLGGVISSALIGGIGIGGIIGGVALAAKDARVQDSWMALGERASAAFAKVGEPFVKPVLGAIAVLDGAMDSIAGSMRDALQGIAPTLVPLTKGLVGLVQEMMPGLVLGLNRARPLLLVIGQELPKIGRAIGDFFQIIARDPQGAIIAFRDLSRIIQGTIVITGRFLVALTLLWAKISPFLKASHGDLAGMAQDMAVAEQAMADAKAMASELGGGLEDLAGSANEANNKMLGLNQSILDFLEIAQSAEKTNMAYERTWDDMIAKLAEAKRTLDITTEAGRENREAIEAHIDAIVERHRQRIEEGQTLEQSLPIMDAELDRLQKQLIAMGYNEQAASALIDIYARWPTRAVTVIEAQGLDVTIERVQELISLFRLANNITIGGVAGAKVGGKRAAGGPVLSGQTYLVGEQGPELLTMGSTNGNVTNAAQTAAMMSGASGGSVSSVTLNVTAQATGRPLEDVVMETIAYRLRVTGGVIGQFKVPRA